MAVQQLPAWCQPEWKDDDIFLLSKIDADLWKTRVATVVKCRWRGNVPHNTALPWAHEVAGVQPITPELFKDKHTAFRDALGSPPASGATAETVAKWKSDLKASSQLACVINGCLMSWEAHGSPWNKGYIANFWSKFESGERSWDNTIERKAGGVDSLKEPDIQQISFSLSSASSVMALVRAVLGHVVRTGACPEHLARAFMSIRIAWLFHASPQEIANVGIAENLEQHTRRRHTELDNLFQVQSWMIAMDSATPKRLDSKNRLDVVKFAMALSDPLRPDDVPQWLKALLNGKPNTQSNRIEVMTTQGVTKKYLDKEKAAIRHPEMNNYNKIQLRVRAVLGFHEFADLHKQISEELGRRGLLHKPFPLPSSLLLDPNILTSDGFVSPAEKTNVPLWRDGAVGRELQKGMVEVARRRLFEFNMAESVCNGTKSLFANGAAWSAFARVCGPPHYHIHAIVEKHFHSQDEWTDAVKAFRTALWTGEHDSEVTKLVSLLPAALDSQPTQMQRRISEIFPPILTVMQQKDSEAHQLTMTQQRKDELAKRKEDEDAKEKDRNELPAVPAVHDGDITEEIFKDADAQEKRRLCEAMNKDAKKRHENNLKKELGRAAAAVLRQRLVVVDSLNSAKAWMESCSKDGAKARIQYLDWTMLPNLQTSQDWSKLLLKQPSKATQEDIAKKVLSVPSTPITGSLLVRNSRARLDKFFDDVAASYPARYEKTLFVPIELPTKLARAIRSAAARALGPDGDHNEKSGIEFLLRSIGGRAASADDILEDEDAVAAVSAVPAVPDREDDEEKDDSEVEEDGDDNVQGLPLEALSRKQLKGVFGRDALKMLGAMFQHTSKICDQALHQSREETMLITKPSGRMMPYRKAQVHPTVVYSAIQNALACTAASLGPAECFIQVNGGTPEGIVAATMMGFSRVLYVANSEQELNGMRLPTSHEEQLHNMDYHEYTSPSPDNPEMGTIAAHAVQLLTPYVKNFVMEVPGSIVVPSPYHVDVPPIQTFTFIPVTGKVIARTVGSSVGSTARSSGDPAGQGSSASGQGPSASPGQKAASAGPKKNGPGSASGAVLPKTPKKAINIEEGDDDDDMGDGEGDEDGDDDDEGGVDLDAELAAVEQEAASSKKGVKNKAGSDAGSAKKQPKKGAGGKK